MDKVEEQNTDDILHCLTCGSVKSPTIYTENFLTSDSKSVNIKEVLLEVLDVIEVKGMSLTSVS